VEQLRTNAEKLAEALSVSRKKAVSSVEKDIVARLADLGMPSTIFSVNIQEKKLSHDGKDKVEFLFSANKGMPMRPVTQVASGGEIARLMLALKALIGGAVKLPTIIFDEIDTGVSGRIAEQMALIMREMGDKERQVISITHLPQIAARGTHHYRVEKHETPEGTTTSIMRQLSNEEREREIAQMLSGADVSAAALENAKELLWK
jgi:DNA repair protein RecN (Recombination protein N)